VIFFHQKSFYIGLYRFSRSCTVTSWFGGAWESKNPWRIYRRQTSCRRIIAQLSRAACVLTMRRSSLPLSLTAHKQQVT